MNRDEISKNVDAICGLTAFQSVILNSLKEGLRDIYIPQYVYRIKGSLDLAKLNYAWRLVCDKHSILKGIFVKTESTTPRFVIFKSAEANIKHLDWEHKSQEEFRNSLNELKKSERIEVSKLSKVGLYEISIVKESRNDFWLISTMHHLITDGWSSNIILKDLLGFYKKLCLGVDVEEVKDSYWPSIVVNVNRRDRCIFKQSNYHHTAVNGVGTSALVDQTHDSNITAENGEVQLHLNSDAEKAIKDVSIKHGLSYSSIFQAVWVYYCSTINGVDSVVYGIVLNGRSNITSADGLDEAVGPLLLTVPVCVNNVSKMTLKEISEKIQKVITGLQTDEQYNDDNVQIDFAARVDTVIVVENFPKQSQLSVIGDELEVFKEASASYNHYKLSIVVNASDCVDVVIKYKSKEFTEESMQILSEDIVECLCSFEVLKTTSCYKKIECNKLSKCSGMRSSVKHSQLHSKVDESGYGAESNTLIETQLTTSSETRLFVTPQISRHYRFSSEVSVLDVDVSKDSLILDISTGHNDYLFVTPLDLIKVSSVKGDIIHHFKGIIIDYNDDYYCTVSFIDSLLKKSDSTLLFAFIDSELLSLSSGSNVCILSDTCLQLEGWIQRDNMPGVNRVFSAADLKRSQFFPVKPIGDCDLVKFFDRYVEKKKVDTNTLIRLYRNNLFPFPARYAGNYEYQSCIIKLANLKNVNEKANAYSMQYLNGRCHLKLWINENVVFNDMYNSNLDDNTCNSLEDFCKIEYINEFQESLKQDEFMSCSDQAIGRDIKKIWEELLDRKIEDANQSFFSMGGSSLLLIKLCARLKRILPEILRNRISVTKLYELYSINMQTEYLRLLIADNLYLGRHEGHDGMLMQKGSANE